MILIYSFVTYILSICFFSIVGFVFVSKDRERPVLSVFNSMVIGVTTTIMAYALIKARFHTFYVTAFIPLAFYVIRNRKIPFFNPLSGLTSLLTAKTILLLAGYATLSFFLISLHLYDYKILCAQSTTFYDIHFYSDVARVLRNFGMESYYSRFFPYHQPGGTEFYHFFDTWMAAFVSGCSGINTFHILVLVVYPLFLFLTFIGAFSVGKEVENYTVTLIILPVIAMLILAFHPLFLEHFDVFQWSQGVLITSYLCLKILVIFPFFLFAFNRYKSNDVFGFVIFLILSTIVYSTLLVPIIPAMLILYIYKFVLNYKYNTIQYKIVLTTIVCFALSVAIFHIITADKLNVDNVQIEKIKSIKSLVIIFSETVFKNIILYLPFFAGLLLLTLLRRLREYIVENAELLIFAAVSLLGSALFITIFHGTMNYSQAFYNYIPAIMLVLLISVLRELDAKYIIGFAVLFGSVNIHASIQKDYYNKVMYSHEFVQRCDSTFVAERCARYLTCTVQDNLRWQYNFDELGQFMSKYDSIPSGFNFYNDFRETTPAKNYSPYGRWCVEKGKTIDAVSLKQYFELYRIKFVFIKDTSILPAAVGDLFVIKASDPMSNEKLVMLR